MRINMPRHNLTLGPTDETTNVVWCSCGYRKSGTIEEARALALIHLLQTSVAEPVFIFRAHDVLLPSILREYERQLHKHGSPATKRGAVSEHYDKVIEWQEAHGSKVPD